MVDYCLHKGAKDAFLISEELTDDYEVKFAKIVARIVADILDVNYNDRRIVEGLVFVAIKKHFVAKGMLLEQYLHTQLDRIAQTIRSEFGISDDVSVNYSHATHAKFSDLIKAIKEKCKSDEKSSDEF